jgi:hypothetical protein
MLSYFFKSSEPTTEDFEIVEAIDNEVVTEQVTEQELFLLEIACLRAELDHKNKELENLKKNTAHCKIVNDNKPFVYYYEREDLACDYFYYQLIDMPKNAVEVNIGETQDVPCYVTEVPSMLIGSKLYSGFDACYSWYKENQK